jgi:hypothetical protein
VSSAKAAIDDEEITGISVSMYANPDTFMYNTLFRKFNTKESQLFSFSKLFDYETQTRLENICLRNQFFNLFYLTIP